MWIIVIIICLILMLLYQYGYGVEHFSDDLYDKMDIYVINLKSRPQKREFMEKQMKKNNLNATIFEAVDGSKLDLEDLLEDGIISPTKNKEIRRYLRKGEIGCALSHMLIWLRLLNSQKQYALIFEDDAILCNDFKEMLRGVISEANTVPWDILYLNENCYWRFRDGCDGPMVTKRIMAPTNVGYGLYGYIIKRDAVPKYIEGILPFKIPIDNYIIEKQKDDNNRVLRLEYPMVEINRKFKSDTIGIK